VFCHFSIQMTGVALHRIHTTDHVYSYIQYVGIHTTGFQHWKNYTEDIYRIQVYYFFYVLDYTSSTATNEQTFY